MNQKKPKISVVMPVFNRQEFVNEAVNSILAQSFSDFEFIIVDDGSSDLTPELIKSYSDKRIKPILNKINKGNYAARNEGMRLAQGKYICVMDSDDIALPNRLQKQYYFMEANKHIGLCGSFIQIMKTDQIITSPEDYEEIKVWSMSNIMLRHPTVFIRMEFLQKYNLQYNENYRYAADYDFIVTATHLFPVTSIPEVLLEYRKHPEQISSTNFIEQYETVKTVILSQLIYFKKNITEKEKQLHLALMNRVPIHEESEFQQLKEWANYLLKRNYENKHFQSDYLATFLKSLLKFIYKQYEISIKKKNVFIETKQTINNVLNPIVPLNFEKDWAILPDLAMKLVDLIKEEGSSTKIVECGSGLSTLILGYLVKNRLISHVYSIEHNAQFYELTKKEILIHGLNKFITLIYSPLKQVQIGDEKWEWYDLSKIYRSLKQIDILLVDGPPGMIQKHSRYPAVPLLKKFFNQNTIIVMDDSARSDEQEIIKRWEQENPEFKSTYINTVKGMCVLKQNNKP